MMGNTNAYIYLDNNDKESSFTLNENKKNIKTVYLPKDCKIQFTRPIIKFQSNINFICVPRFLDSLPYLLYEIIYRLSTLFINFNYY